MSDFILQLESVMRADIRSLDAIAHNSANSMTPGYRSLHPVFSHEGIAGVVAGDAAKASSSAPRPYVVRNTDGPLEISSVGTHLAIRGDGWFVVETPDGPRLTRDGRFRLSPEGGLVDRAGNPVAVESGALTGLDAEFAVMADGSVSVRGKTVGRLQIVTPGSGSDLEPQGGGLYRSSGDLVPAPSAAVVQGAYEASNVDTAADMLLLMNTSRHVETLQRSMSAYDGVLGTAINQLGK
jgi:flagellar basal body rod protein FlgG